MENSTTGALNCFLCDFIPSIDKNEGNDIDISDICQTILQFTPIDLQCSRPDEAFLNMSSVVVTNFCNTYLNTKMFPKKALIALRNILMESVAEESGRAKISLMIHATKMRVPKYYAALFYKNVVDMIVTEPMQEFSIWQTLADQTIKHPEIIKVIENTIMENFGSLTSMASEPISTEFVINKNEGLRGFSGVNKIFINYDFFSKKQNDYRNHDLVNSIMQMDIITISIHEFAHARLRQNFNNFNINSPAILANIIKEEDRDFGRIIEMKLFKDQIDWYKSIETVNPDFVNKFIYAIQYGRKLPPISENYGVVFRRSLGMGVDISDDHYIC